MHSERYRALLQVLIAARKDAGLTQVVLASRLHKPQPYVSKIERGERRIDVVEFCAWAQATGVTPEAALASYLKS